MNGKTTLRTLWSIFQSIAYILILLLFILQMTAELFSRTFTTIEPVQGIFLYGVLISVGGLIMSLFFLFRKSLVKRNIGLLVLLNSYLLLKWITIIVFEGGCIETYRFAGFKVTTKEQLMTYLLAFTLIIITFQLIFLVKKRLITRKAITILLLLIVYLLMSTFVSSICFY